jgi:hypothetical protein
MNTKIVCPSAPENFLVASEGKVHINSILKCSYGHASIYIRKSSLCIICKKIVKPIINTE